MIQQSFLKLLKKIRKLKDSEQRIGKQVTSKPNPYTPNPVFLDLVSSRLTREKPGHLNLFKNLERHDDKESSFFLY